MELTSNTTKRRHPSDGDSVNSQQKKPNSSKAEMMVSLECPVCLEIPRAGAGPIFGCRNGHVLCQGCITKIAECPICREKEIHCRNLVAEKYIEMELRDFPFKCKFIGCPVSLPMTNNKLSNHERFCAHREVTCPSSKMDACNWRGPLVTLVKHMKEKKCVQVVFDDNWKKDWNPSGSDDIGNIFQFKSNLGDYPSNAVSVFEKTNVITHWKPVVLLARGILNIWCYLLVQRDSKGVWTLLTYSMLPKDCLDVITVKVTIYGSKDCTRFNFESKLISFETTKDEAINMGNYMSFLDSQVKPFKEANKNTIFNYTVEIQADPDFLGRLNKRSSVKIDSPTDHQDGDKK